MAQPNTQTETKGTKLNLLKTSNGSRDKFQKFLQSAKIYMGINDKSYSNDLKKIGFVLSFMTKGQAKGWADQFIEQANNQNSNPGILNLGTYANF